MTRSRTLEDVRQYLRRTIAVERVVLFVKLAVIGLAFSMVVLGVGPIRQPATSGFEDFGAAHDGGREAALVKSVQYFNLQLLLYTIGNAIFWFCLFVLGARISRYLFIRTTAFLLVIIDILFVTLLIWSVPQVEKSLFWLYCFGLVHAVLLFPDAITMILMTVLSGAFYLGAVTWSIPTETAKLPLPSDPDFRAKQELIDARAETQRRERILSMIILGITGAGCWGANAFIQMRLRALNEEQERVIRTEKLNLAAMMASNIAHELKNPFAIINNAAFLLRRDQENLDESQRKQVSVITSEVRRSDRIVMDLLGYAKLAGGKIERVDVTQVIDDAFKDLHNEMRSRQIAVAKSYKRNLPPLLIDRTQLRTLVSNLLLNACEAIESAGKITVRTDYTDDGFIEIAIADTGVGISDEDLPKVFDSSFTTKEAGSGLGLSIVESIARAYGGGASVESKKGVGTSFTVRLPTRTAREKH